MAINEKNTLHQIDIALVQLEKACELYFQNNPICALTLAGAAEEILGEIANKQSQTFLGLKGKERGVSALNLQAGIMSAFGGKGYFEFIKEKNALKNSFKHAIPGYETNISDLNEKIIQFIGDAVTNYKLISGQLPNLPFVNMFCIEYGVS